MAALLVTATGAKALSLKAFIMQEITEKTKDSDLHENFNYGLYVAYKF